MELFNEPTIQRKTLSEIVSQDNVVTGQSINNSSFNGGQITIGSGENVFTANRQGIYLGSSSFATAPFSVDMQGNLYASSATIAGDIVSSNYSGTAPYAGYKLEYSTGDGYFNQIKIRGGSNSYFISDTIDTQAKSILKDFSFSDTDYSGAFKTGDITWNTTTGAITGGSGGLFNKGGLVFAYNGTPTITLNGTTGEATFSGNVSGATITGSLFQTTAGTGQRVELEGTNNTLTFYNTSNESVVQLGGGTLVGRALRVDLDEDTTTGVDVRSSQANDIGFQYVSSGNYDSAGANIQLTGATNSSTGININHDGDGGEGIYIDTSAGARPLQISNTGSGTGIYMNNTSSVAMQIFASSDTHNGIELDYTGRKDALYITSSDTSSTGYAINTNVSAGGCAKFSSSFGNTPILITHTANSGNPIIQIDSSTNVGSAIYINKDKYGTGAYVEIGDNSNHNSIGITLDIINASYPDKTAAFHMSGTIKKYTSGATLSGLDGVIKVFIDGNLRYIPYYTTYS